MNRINSLCGENVYSPVHLRRKLRDHFGDNIIITDIVGKSSAVTLMEAAKSILQTFYNRPKHENHEDEKKAIIKAAAQLIKSDVPSLTGEKDVYPTAKDIGSTEANLSFIPDSLKLFMRNLCGEKNQRFKSVFHRSGNYAAYQTPDSCITPANRTWRSAPSQLCFPIFGIYLKHSWILLFLL